MSNLEKLTKTEEEVMQYIWEQGPTTVTDMIEKMEDPKPPHSTISSIFRILEGKGFLGHESRGRTYEYYAKVAKDKYTNFSIKKLVSNYFEGSMNKLVSFLVLDNDITMKELEEIKKKVKSEDSEE
jgi:predicted transcriptional regulator